MLCEPLFQFLLIAGALFAANHFWGGAGKEKIVIDAQTAAYLIKQREDLELRKLTPGERRETIDAFLEDELLYREAYKRGMDKGDSRMRRNLILKMRGLFLTDAAPMTEENLRAFFEENRADYVAPPAISIEQVYFPNDAEPPDGLLEELRGGRDSREFKESFSQYGSRVIKQVSAQELAGTLGPEAAASIWKIGDEQWHGPFASIFGRHFVRVTARHPSRDYSFEEVKNSLAGDYSMVQSREAIEAEVEKLKEEYEIVVEAPEGGVSGE